MQSANRIERLLTSTIINGTNNSVLVVGAPGSAKLEVVQTVLNKITGQFNLKGTSPIVGVVRLSGLIHNDECGALREIARQLCNIWELHFLRSASFSTNLRFLRYFLALFLRQHHCVT